MGDFMKYALGVRAPKNEFKTAEINSEKAFLVDRNPTINELASTQFMGLVEQRPAEMLKNEL